MWYRRKPIITDRVGTIFTGVCYSVQGDGGMTFPTCITGQMTSRGLTSEGTVNPGIRSICGWYASYWNAYLFCKVFAEKCMEMKEIGLGGFH